MFAQNRNIEQQLKTHRFSLNCSFFAGMVRIKCCSSYTNMSTTGQRYIRDYYLGLGRRYRFGADAWVGKALFQKGSGGKTIHVRNKNSAQKTSVTLVYKKQNQIIFPPFWRGVLSKTTLKQGWFFCFLTLKVYCDYSKNGKNVKITQAVAIPILKHNDQVWK